MRARALAVPAPVVSPSEPARKALEILAGAELPGVVVSDGDTYFVVPSAQVLRLALPRYVQDDPSLGRVWDEQSADALATRLEGRTVRDLLDLPVDPRHPEPAVEADATLVEMAAVMAAARVPLVAVVDRGHYLGVVTVHRLVSQLLA